MSKITSTWKEQKRITNGEQRHFLGTRNRPHLEMGGDFGKKTLKKKMKILHAGVIFGKKKQKIENFTWRDFNRPFSKSTFFSPIYKGDYLSTFDFKVCFFSLLPIWYLGQNAFLEQFSTKIAKNQPFRIGVTLWIFVKNSQKSTIFDRGNPMNFLQN